MSTFREARQWPIWGKMVGTTKRPRQRANAVIRGLADWIGVD